MRILTGAVLAVFFCCGWLLSACPPAHAAEAAPDPIVQASADDHALAERAEQAIKAAQGTPGQEAANFMADQTCWMHDQLRMLAGEKPATAGQLKFARETIGNLTETAAKGPGWPLPALRRIPYTRAHITIDGKLDERAWRHAASYQQSYPLNDKQAVTAPATTWRVLWDQHYLYFAFDVTDDNILSEPETSHRGIYEGDCVEIFILPDINTAKYWELIFNPAGDLFQALHTKSLDKWGPAPGEQPVKMEGLQVARVIGKSGYTIEAAVPIAQLPGFTAKSIAKKGMRFHLLLARFDKSATGTQFLYNQPMLSWGHNIWNYGTVELVK